MQIFGHPKQKDTQGIISSLAIFALVVLVVLFILNSSQQYAPSIISQLPFESPLYFTNVFVNVKNIAHQIVDYY